MESLHNVPDWTFRSFEGSQEEKRNITKAEGAAHESALHSERLQILPLTLFLFLTHTHTHTHTHIANFRLISTFLKITPPPSIFSFPVWWPASPTTSVTSAWLFCFACNYVCVALENVCDCKTQPPMRAHAHAHTAPPIAAAQLVQMWARLGFMGFLNEDGSELTGGSAVVFLSSHHKQKTQQDCRLVNRLGY